MKTIGASVETLKLNEKSTKEKVVKYIGKTSKSEKNQAETPEAETPEVEPKE